MIRRFACSLLLTAALAQADAPSEPQPETPRQRMEQRGADDGSLLAMAVFCKYPVEQNQKLLAKMTDTALTQAQQEGAALSKEEYRDMATPGYQATANFLRWLPMQGENYESNCKEVAEKIAKRMNP
jgi:hypothetical protein